MDSLLQSVHLDIPQADLNFFKELAKKMGWRVTVSTNKNDAIQVDAKRNIINELHGCIRLPENFDYKKELERAICEKYL
ncbi:hypothetical protein [Phocaeicola sartorii]|uniref:hypothetical protein n=1 Tax=Phocaeicola sartorii TaxID=671267 RepID=UPI0035112C53